MALAFSDRASLRQTRHRSGAVTGGQRAGQGCTISPELHDDQPHPGLLLRGRGWQGSRCDRPVYAAWATPMVHDTRAGLRINAQCQVIDMLGQVIPGLYCGGESAGGFNQHGLGRCTTQGYIAGKSAAAGRS